MMDLDLDRIQQLLADDQQYVWHPYAQMKRYKDDPPMLLTRAEGPFLYDAEGKRYYDAISSWWVNTHGHRHPTIVAALKAQLDTMDHVMFSRITHPAAIQLAQELVSLTPEKLTKVFYSDNGSTAVEVALKMSLQYWQLSGHPGKSVYAFLDGGYHGDTVGAMSIGGVDDFHGRFQPIKFAAHRLPAPVWYADDAALHGLLDCTSNPDAMTEQSVANALTAAEQLFQAHGEQLAAFILEPMVQAAGGMRIMPASYLKQIRKLCTAYDVHLIADEVAVAFGRTGKMFACEHADVTPDIMCLSKALNAGMLPMAVTMVTEEIYQAFYGEAQQQTFYHGHSYTGNPLAAAVGVASLQVFREEHVLDRVSLTAAHLQSEWRSRFTQYAGVSQVRGIGMICALDMPDNARALLLTNTALRYGVFLRPLGRVIYLWLPLCLTVADITDLLDRTEAAFREVL